jgi:hypothetical protein
MSDFASTIAAAYAATGPAVELGRGVHDGAVSPEAEAKAEHQEAAGALGAFLKTKQRKQLEKEVVHGVFGLLKKRM